MAFSGFLVIDKEAGWTSHDVVAKARGILRNELKKDGKMAEARALKVGHLGTLDPMATGVLVLAVGREATKKVSEFMKLDKEYEVEIELGKVSDTYDAEGIVKETGVDFSDLDLKKLETVLNEFWGKTLQFPPPFSAKKVGGVRAYKLARKGKPVNLKEVEVSMQGRDLTYDAPFLRFTVEVSSGTYIRSLAHDLGARLGCGAILSALRRTRVGDFDLKEAKTVEDFERQIAK